jgi:Tol biopolymer transport system component
MRRLLLVDSGGGVSLCDLDATERRRLTGPTSAEPPSASPSGTPGSAGPESGSPASGSAGATESAEKRPGGTGEIVGTPGAAAGSAGGPAPVRTAVWSSAGRWAAYAVDADDLDGPHELRLHDPASGTTRLIATALTAFYLCPSPCGRYLSHLSPGPLGLELAVSDIATGELRVLERGQPLFWSWSPDSSQIAVHVAQRVLILPVDGGPSRLLTETAGPFVAPWWMPDASVAIGMEEKIVSHGPDGLVTPLVPSAPAGRFALDPDGRRLALVDVVEGVICLVVVDLLTGERSIVATERTAGFFWSPDGRQLAALVLAGPNEVQWIVSDGDAVERLAPFRPGVAWAREVLPFFEQYAQSHAVWSADATMLVAPAIDANGSSEAVLQRARPPFTTERLPGVRLAWWACE